MKYDKIINEFNNLPMQLVLEAVEKQVPMKSDVMIRCGRCGRTFDAYGIGHYCPYCGQRKDWSEENDN